MRPLPVRTKVRWLMVTVALAAIVCWLGVRHQRFQRMAAYHESRAPTMMAGSLTRGLVGIDRLERRVTDAEAEWHWLMAQKYRRAARMPWLPVSPARSLEQYCEEYAQGRYERALLIEKGVSPKPPGLDP